MKKLIFSAIAAGNLFIVSSCKKQNTEEEVVIPKQPAHANTPTAAYYNYEQTSQGWAHFIYFFDLSAGETANKKYFKLQLKYVGSKDSFEIVSQPAIMDSLCKGFPAEIRDNVGFGWVNQWTNSSYRLLKDFGSNQYYKDTIVRNPQSNIYFLNQLYTSPGQLTGKWPQSNLDYVNEPLGNGQVRRHIRTIFWFKEGWVFDQNDMEPAGMKPLTNYMQGTAGYDWANVNSAVQISGIGTGTGFQNLYFFDFKNWRFFKWMFYINTVGGIGQQAVVYEDYQSLNNFCKWPAGWGKK